MKLFALIVLLVSSLAYAKLPTKRIKVGQVSLLVEVAKTDKEQQKGLMYRKSLDDSRGMLFVFEKPEVLKFWMKNTFIPLSIGYFDAKKELIEVLDMEPVKSEMAVNLPFYSSSKPAMYALEVNRGWFKKNNIKKGAKLAYPGK